MARITPVDISKVYTEVAQVAKRPRVRIKREAVKITEEEIANNAGVKRPLRQSIPKNTNEENFSKYLYPATFNNSARFKKEQVHDISKTMSWYRTEQDKTALLKELLEIGVKQGSPLKAKEIRGYLTVTSGMSEQEQRNVLNVLNASKDYDKEKCSLDSLRKKYTYDNFKKQNANRLNADSPETQDYVLKNLYETALKRKYDVENAGTSFYLPSASHSPTISEALTNGRNPLLVKAFAKTKDWHLMFDLVRVIGVNESFAHSAEALVDIQKLTSNLAITLDLTKSFYPSEIKQIARLLGEMPKDSLKTMVENYVGSSNMTNLQSKRGFLSNQRMEILKQLGIVGKINLLPIDSRSNLYTHRH